MILWVELFLLLVLLLRILYNWYHHIGSVQVSETTWAVGVQGAFATSAWALFGVLCEDATWLDPGIPGLVLYRIWSCEGILSPDSWLVRMVWKRGWRFNQADDDRTWLKPRKRWNLTAIVPNLAVETPERRVKKKPICSHVSNIIQHPFHMRKTKANRTSPSLTSLFLCCQTSDFTFSGRHCFFNFCQRNCGLKVKTRPSKSGLASEVRSTPATRRSRRSQARLFVELFDDSGCCASNITV